MASATDERRAWPGVRVWPGVAVWLMFLAFGAVRAPVPAVNEPHYLGKAERFYNPAFAPGDFFLGSSNPHLVFYATFGPLTRVLPSTAAAWTGRAIAYGLLAVGWVMLARRVAGSRTAGVTAAAVFLLLAAAGNLSGEWLVGGVESKVVAYALVFAGLAWRLEGRPDAAAAALGGAAAFHPIVGVWAAVCTAAAQAWTRRRTPWATGWRPPLRAGGIFLAVAAPGLIPAVLTLGGTDAAGAARATYLQVFVRLSHHLDPTTFPATVWAMYAALTAGWLALSRGRSPASDAVPAGWFRAMVLTSAAIAVAGAAIGWHVGEAWGMPLRDLRGTLLKFYPFRLADVLIPLAFSLAAAARLTSWTRDRPARMTAVLAVTIAAFAVALTRPAPDRYPDRLPPAARADWLAVCRFARTHTPPDAVFVTPARHWGFRWHARRAEFVNYKDMPQDAPSLLEWQHRFTILTDWAAPFSRRPVTRADLHTLRRLTGADYFLADPHYGPITAPPIFENPNYRVYRLPR